MKRTKQKFIQKFLYLQKIYDEQKRIIECNQISKQTKNADGNILYEYRDNCRIANFRIMAMEKKTQKKKEIVILTG
jgi:hypothetical protein